MKRKYEDLSLPFLGVYRRTVNEVLHPIREATFVEDTRLATDLVLSAGLPRDVRIGLRTLREYYRHGRYKPERSFTLRAKSEHGGETEIDKWRKGIYPDYYMFGWVEPVKMLKASMLIDVERMRATGLFEKLLNSFVIPNTDDATAFVKISVHSLKKAGCLLYYSDDPSLNNTNLFALHTDPYFSEEQAMETPDEEEILPYVPTKELGNMDSLIELEDTVRVWKKVYEDLNNHPDAQDAVAKTAIQQIFARVS